MRSVRPTTRSKRMRLPLSSSPSDAPWRALISADALLENGQYTDAFGFYRAALDALPLMLTIHESVAPYLRAHGPRPMGGNRTGEGPLADDDVHGAGARCASFAPAATDRRSTRHQPSRCRIALLGGPRWPTSSRSRPSGTSTRSRIRPNAAAFGPRARRHESGISMPWGN